MTEIVNVDWFASDEVYVHELPPTASGKEQWVKFKKELDSFDDLMLTGHLVDIKVDQGEDGIQRNMEIKWAEHQQATLETYILDWKLHRGKDDESVPFSKQALRKINKRFRSQLTEVINELQKAELKDESSSDSSSQSSKLTVSIE